MSVTLTQAFLNEPTLEAAREKYLESWTLPAVQKSWNGRRPSLRRFEARFGDAHALRQESLKLQELQGSDPILGDKSIGDIQEIAEAAVKAALESLTPPRFAETSAEDEPETEAEPAIEARTVKPSNAKKLPTTKQLYFFIHRAIEAGHDFVTIPVTRGMAAEGRTMIADGKTYVQAINALSKKAKAAA